MKQYLMKVIEKKAETEAAYAELILDREALDYFVDSLEEVAERFIERNFDLLESAVLIDAEDEETEEELEEEAGDIGE